MVWGLIWVSLAILLIGIQILSRIEFLYMLYFGIGAIIASVLAFIGVGIEIQLSGFIISVVILFFGFQKIVDMVNKSLSRNKFETNVHALIGERGIVIQKIDNLSFSGRIKIGGEEWDAKSEDGTPIDEKSIVVVTGFEGNRLIVKKESDKK